MTSSFSMNMQLQLSLHPLSDGRFSVKGIHEGRQLPMERLVHFLYFDDEDSMFGLDFEVLEEGLVISGSELISMMEVIKRQPFIELTGTDRSDEELLQTADEISRHWNGNGIWKAVTIEEGRVTLDSDTFTEMFSGDSDAALTEQLLFSAVVDKLQILGVQPDQLPSMISYLRTYGWPSRTESDENSTIHVALRLSEPDDEIEDWMLETVIIGKNSVAHWTPSNRKKNEPIHLAVPPKWADQVPYIAEKQEKMLRLIQLEAVPDQMESFLSIPLTDAEVR